MAEKVNPIKSLAFVNPEGQRLTLILGCVTGEDDVKGLRWSIRGYKIPIPVRSGTWFCGFKTDVMVKWLRDHDYVFQGEMNHDSGSMWCAMPGDIIEAMNAVKESTAPSQQAYDELHDNYECLKATYLDVCKANRELNDQLKDAKKQVIALGQHVVEQGAKLAEANKEISDLRAAKLTLDNDTIKHVIRRMCSIGEKVGAIRIYKAIYGCSLFDAKDAVEVIITE